MWSSVENFKILMELRENSSLHMYCVRKSFLPMIESLTSADDLLIPLSLWSLSVPANEILMYRGLGTIFT